MGRIDNKQLVLTLARAGAIATLSVKYSARIPRGLKWFFVFLIALNIRGFPILWHWRVVVPWFSEIIKQQWTHRVHGRDHHLKRLTAKSPVGRNPFELVESWKSRAGTADCDYNGHLSNSSYAKNIDYCRLNAAVRFYPPFIGLGGTLPIAGTYHYFIKEIPLNREYEILTFLPAWESDKWSYLTIAFISRPSKHHGHGHRPKKELKADAKAQTAAKELLKGVTDATPASTSMSDSITSSGVLVPPVTQVGDAAVDSSLVSGVTTPAAPNPSTSGNHTPTPPLFGPLDPEALELLKISLPPNATLHAVAVSQYCYKLGRITIPPRVALIACGFGDPALKRWERLQAIRDAKDGNKKMAQILRGGWRDRETWGDFWDLKEFEGRANQTAATLAGLRGVMGVLGGEGASAPKETRIV